MVGNLKNCFQAGVTTYLAFNPLFDALKKHALHDYSLVLSLDPSNSKFPDWIIVIYFYMALHAVNAHAAQAG